MLAQIPAYNTCLSRYGGAADYLGFFDIDELLVPTAVPTGSQSLPDLLTATEQAAGGGVSSVSFRHYCMRARSEEAYAKAAASARELVGDDVMDKWIRDKIDPLQANKGYLAGPGGKPSIDNPDLGIGEEGETVFSLAGYRSADPDCLHSNLAKHVVRTACARLVAVHESEVRGGEDCRRKIRLEPTGDAGGRLQHYKYVHDAASASTPDESTEKLVRFADEALLRSLEKVETDEVRALVEEVGGGGV
jgi:hypothetical protein